MNNKHMKFSSRMWIALAIFVLVLAGCGGGGGGGVPATGGSSGTTSGGTSTSTLFSITISPGLPASLSVGLTQQFTASATYVNYTTGAASYVDVTNTAVWSSSNAAAASINSAGLASGLAVGSTNITASLSGLTSNTATLNVIPAQLQSMTISPTSATIAAGQSQQFTVTGSYTDGSTQNLNSAVWWSSSNTAAATVNTGLAFGAAPNATPATITASYFPVPSVNATLTVSNYSVGGTVVDLPVGSSVTIQNGTDVLTIAGNGTTPVPFIFPTGVAAGSTYNVTVTTQPGGTAHPCTVVDGGGTIATNFISFAQIVCGPAVGTIAGGLNVVPNSNNSQLTTIIATLYGGFTNGTGTAAQFNTPAGAAYDTLGNLYVADIGNSVIRKITPTGVVSTFAGSGAIGSSNGTSGSPLTATFGYPRGVAVDSSNNVYVADTGNGLVRMITQAGVVTTYAGAGGVGSTNSTNPLLAKFYYPQGVAVDSSGNVYVADTSNNMIRKIAASTKAVTTVAGSTTCTTLTNGTGTAACFNMPTGVTVDKTNTYLYVSDANNNAIRQIVISNQAVTTLAGTGTAGYLDGPCSTALFSGPNNVAVDANNNIYVADTSGSLIRKIVGANTASCTVSILAGLTGAPSYFSDGPAIGAMLPLPTGIAVDASNNVLFTDAGHHLLRKYTP